MSSFKNAESEKCKRCGKSVYHAEEKLAGGFKWHNFCFKCGTCNKMLDSTSVGYHDGAVFCKPCHAKKSGVRGYGYGGGGAGTLISN